jgi:hypothetical protein
MKYVYLVANTCPLRGEPNDWRLGSTLHSSHVQILLQQKGIILFLPVTDSQLSAYRNNECRCFTCNLHFKTFQSFKNFKIPST